MTLGEKLREAAQRATVLSIDDDNLLVTIWLRNYGYLVDGQCEVDDQMRRHSRQLLWDDVEQSRGNPLLLAVDYVATTLKSTPPPPTSQ